MRSQVSRKRRRIPTERKNSRRLRSRHSRRSSASSSSVPSSPSSSSSGTVRDSGWNRDTERRRRSGGGSAEEEGEVVSERFRAVTNSSLLCESRGLLKAYATLHRLHFEGEVSLPRICVLGDQSTGKSSVIESLAGVNLPRGDDIVTRCPCVVTLIRKDEPCILLEDELVDETSHSLAERILERQVELAGSKKDVSDTPIAVEIHGPDFFDLTLIDLPGLVEVEVRGQQQGIRERIERLCMSYVSEPDTIILVVLPAGLDIATVKAFRLAKSVDPDGFRTIGVVTKVDEAKDHELVSRILTQDDFPLKLGFYAVRNRTKAEVLANLPFEEANKREIDFFESVSYGSSLVDVCGHNALASTLANLLKQRMVDAFPEVQRKMSLQLTRKKEELAAMGPRLPDSPTEKRQYLIEMVGNLFQELVMDLTVSMGRKPNSVMSRLKNLYDTFGESVMDPSPDYLGEDWKRQIMERHPQAKAGTLCGFLSHSLFQDITKGRINECVPHVKALIESVHQLLDEFVQEILHRRTEGLGEVGSFIALEFRRFLDEITENALKRSLEMIEMEKSFIFTHNHYFAETIDAHRKQSAMRLLLSNAELFEGKERTVTISRRAETIQTFSPPEEWHWEDVQVQSNEEQETHDFQVLLHSYHKVLQKRVMDVIPPIVDFQLRIPIKSKLCGELIGRFVQMQDEKLNQIVSEEPTIKRKRERLERDLNKYREGIAVLHTIRL